MGAPLDRRALVEELTARCVERPGSTRHDLAAIARQLVDDWADEADPMPDPAAVLRFQREDLERAIADAGSATEGLRVALLRRRIDHVGAKTLDAARRRAQGDASSASEAQGLLDEVEALATSIDGLPPTSGSAAGELRRTLGDPMLEARFAIDGTGAMSPRLARDVGPDIDPSTAPPPGLRPA